MAFCIGVNVKLVLAICFYGMGLETGKDGCFFYRPLHGRVREYTLQIIEGKKSMAMTAMTKILYLCQKS